MPEKHFPSPHDSMFIFEFKEELAEIVLSAALSD